MRPAAFVPILCLVLGGCVTSRFQLVDAETGEPLKSVEGKCYGHRSVMLFTAPVDTLARLKATGADGLVTSRAAWRLLGLNTYKFYFRRPGYHETRVDAGSGIAVITYPARGEGREKTVSSRRLIVVPMCPIRRDTSCPACAYDLRATSGMCPECGRAPAEVAA